MKLLTRRNGIAQAESLGLILQSFLVSIQRKEYQPVLDKYGITDFDPDAWYPMQLILEIFEAVQNSTNATQNLVSIGIKVVEVVDFKSRFPTLIDLVENLPQLEQDLHRNNPGYWEVKRVSPNCIEIMDRTVWPHDLEYGVLYGFTNLYSDENDYSLERVRVETDPKTGDEVGVYRITW